MPMALIHQMQVGSNKVCYYTINFMNMKKIRIKILAVAFILFAMGCDNEDSYDYDAIVPVVLNGIQGPTQAVQTFTGTYTTAYSRGGSKWNWTISDAKIKSTSEDTRTIVVEFNTFPADEHATISVTETTHGGLTSEAKTLEVLVKKYCALTNGVKDLVGSWTGIDGEYDSQITTKVNGTKLAVSGMSAGLIADWWGETIVSGGTFNMTINEDGTLDIPRQSIYTTDYKGALSDYEIEGSGSWDNCGAAPKLEVKYDIYYVGDAKGIGATYLGANFTANITLSK
jgi:hypothetical protein